MKNLGYYNGKFGPLEEMQVPMLDRGTYFGDGVYDASYASNHTIFALQDHINRFFNSAKLLGINIPHTKEELADILCEMVKKVDSPDQFVYWQVTRGTAIRNHVYQEGMTGNIWIMLVPKGVQNKNKEMNLISVEDKRFFYNNIKTINLIPAVLYSTQANREGFDECVLHRGERVTECAHSNISILKDGCFITAPTDEYILPGIARKHLIEACHRLNVPVKEIVYTMDELMNADEVIVSSSTNLCLRTKTVDGKEVGFKDPALFKKLSDAVYSEFEEYTKAGRRD